MVPSRSNECQPSGGTPAAWTHGLRRNGMHLRSRGESAWTVQGSMPGPGEGSWLRGREARLRGAGFFCLWPFTRRLMRVRTSAYFSDRTDALIRQMERVGYAVSVHRLCDRVEMHALPLGDSYQRYLARVADGGAEKHAYRCAVELARMVGVN